MGTPLATATIDLGTVAAGLRALVLHANKHPGGASSATEAVAALCFSAATSIAEEGGDRLVYSKGHAAAPLYAALWALGSMPGMTWQQLADFGALKHPVPRMPRRGTVPGVLMSAGALGQGLSFGAGLALADRVADTDRYTYVLLGDGECTEGQVWEAAATATRLGLRNVVALVDANGSGSVIELDRDLWKPRFESLGWYCEDVDGNDAQQIADALIRVRSAIGPAALILHTVKGKGLHPDVEGSNVLSAAVDPAMLPRWDTQALISAALTEIDRWFPQAAARRTATPSAGQPIDQTSRRASGSVRGYVTGSVVTTKQRLMPELVHDFAGWPLLLLAPDAIRNCGLLGRMTERGSWTWDNPGSDVLQCMIAEQDAASLAAGVAAGGRIPVLYSMEAFYWRMLDQIRQSVVFSQLPVLLVGASGGIGDLLGPMVQSDGVLAALDAIPGLDIVEAADINAAKLLAAYALQTGQPTYLRIPHEATTVRNTIAELHDFGVTDGLWVLREVSGPPDVVIAVAGALRDVALSAAEQLTNSNNAEIRVVEVFGVTRARRLNLASRSAYFPDDALLVSLHNAPSRILGDLIGADIAIGVDGFGLCGPSLPELYEAAGMTAEHLATRIATHLA